MGSLKQATRVDLLAEVERLRDENQRLIKSDRRKIVLEPNGAALIILAVDAPNLSPVEKLETIRGIAWRISRYERAVQAAHNEGREIPLWHEVL